MFVPPRRVNGHDVAAGLLVKTVGPQTVSVSDAKGRWVQIKVGKVHFKSFSALIGTYIIKYHEI